MKPASIRLKLTLWFVGVLLVILALYSAWVGWLLWRNLAEALDHHLDEDFHFAVQMIEPSGPDIVWRGVDDHDPGYEGGVRRWVEVWSPDGRLLFSRGSPEVESLQRLLPAPIPSPLHRIVHTSSGRLRVVAQQVNLRGTPVVVRVARTESAEWEELRPTVVALLLGIPLCLVAAGAGGYVMARRALGPVAQMADRARHISAEQLDARLPISNPHDELGQLAGVFNETFARIEQSFASLRRFTGDASHELRTPLTALRSVGEVGLSHLRTGEEYRDIIGSMLEEASRLSRLVDGLLLLSRADAGHTHLAREPVDVCSEIRDIAGQLSVVADERAQTIRVDAPGNVWIGLDRGTFRHAVANLLDNAMKYGPPESVIRVSVGRQDREVVIEVADEGPGIPPEHQERIFERFYRVDKARSREVGGSGLGLSIARWAVELHGGRLTLVPDVPGETCFRIALPLDA